jgi:hypothetical protein
VCSALLQVYSQINKLVPRKSVFYVIYVELSISCVSQLQRQAAESEATRRGLERARQEVVRQVTAIAAEKDSLEKEASDSLFFIDFKPP